MANENGYIYIMTNKGLIGMVKIGYAADVEIRRKQLSTTALPYDYETYAVYETPNKISDVNLHKLIDKLNPNLRVRKNREFFEMSPEDAYEMLESIAIISGTSEKLYKIQTNNTNNHKKSKKQMIINKDDPRKIGSLVRESMRSLEKAHYFFSQRQIDEFQTLEWSKQVFGLNYPFFIPIENDGKDAKGYSRYYKEPYSFNGKKYRITNDWYINSKEKYLTWFNELAKE